MAARRRRAAGAGLAAQRVARRRARVARRLRLCRRCPAADAVDARHQHGRHRLWRLVDRAAARGGHRAAVRLRHASATDVMARREARRVGGGPGGAATLATHRLVRAACMAGDPLRAARHRSRVASALSVGCVGAMGDQGARLVRTGSHRSFRPRRRVAGGRPGRLVRRVAELSGDRTVAAGVDLHRAGSMGRLGHELAVVSDPVVADRGDLRSAAQRKGCAAGGAHRCVLRRVVAAAGYPRRTRRLRGPADGCRVHAGGAGDLPVVLSVAVGATACWRCFLPSPAL